MEVLPKIFTQGRFANTKLSFFSKFEQSNFSETNFLKYSGGPSIRGLDS